MSITQAFFDQLCVALGNGNAARPGIEAELREAYPGVVFSTCSDNDIPSRVRPLAAGEGFALYGVSTSGHCASLTMQREAAGGIAIALLDDDD